MFHCAAPPSHRSLDPLGSGAARYGMDFEEHHDEDGECLSDPCPYCRRHEDDEDDDDQ